MRINHFNMHHITYAILNDNAEYRKTALIEREKRLTKELSTIRAQLIEMGEKERMPTIEDVYLAVCNHFKVDPIKAKAKTRKTAIVRVRQVACYLMKKKTKASLKDIGEVFGQDHTTVIHSIRAVGNDIDTELYDKDEILSII